MYGARRNNITVIEAVARLNKAADKRKENAKWDTLQKWILNGSLNGNMYRRQAIPSGAA